MKRDLDTRGERIAALKTSLAERNEQLQVTNKRVVEGERRIEEFTATVALREGPDLGGGFRGHASPFAPPPATTSGEGWSPGRQQHGDPLECGPVVAQGSVDE